jgi:hypothetical protein
VPGRIIAAQRLDEPVDEAGPAAAQIAAAYSATMSNCRG